MDAGDQQSEIKIITASNGPQYCCYTNISIITQQFEMVYIVNNNTVVEYNLC